MQQDETANGIPVGAKRKAVMDSSDIINGSTEHNSGEKNHTREGKQKRKKKKQDEKIENEKEKHGKECTEEKKGAKKKRKRSEDNLNVGSCFDAGVTPEEGNVESKKKKKKKSQFDNRTTVSNANSDHKNDFEEAALANANSKSVEKASNEPLGNGSSENDASAVNGDARLSPEKNDHASPSTVEKKVLRKAASFNSEPFAKFQKNSTPPAFVRKCLSKTPNTEPRKSKTSRNKVCDTLLL